MKPSSDYLVRRLRLRHLELLVALADAGTMRAAATRLHLSQPALSKMLGEIETGFGARLFERSPQGLAANALGDAVVYRARVILGELARGSDEVAALRSGAQGVLRLGTLSVTAAVPKAVVQLRRRLPGALVQIQEGRVRDLIQRLLHGELDGVFGAITPELLTSELLPLLRPEVLLEDELCVLCAEGHPLARSRRLRWADLQAGAWVAPPKDTLVRQALNQAAASLYRDRFGPTPGIVYAAGVDHAYHLAQEFRAAGLKTMAVSGRTPPRELAETLAAYERGEINVLINAQLLAEGWNSPRATVCMHLAPTASKRVYQQRIGRIMRTHPRKEAGIVVDFVPKGATHSERVVSLHSLLDSDFYREGARVTPAPRRRSARRARRRLSPAPWLVPVTQDVSRRLAVIQREWQRVDPRYLDEEEQRFWARIAGRQARFDDRVALVEKLSARASKAALDQFLFTCAAENPNRPDRYDTGRSPTASTIASVSAASCASN